MDPSLARFMHIGWFTNWVEEIRVRASLWSQSVPGGGCEIVVSVDCAGPLTLIGVDGLMLLKRVLFIQEMIRILLGYLDGLI